MKSAKHVKSHRYDMIFLDYDEMLFNNKALHVWMDKVLSDEGLISEGDLEEDIDSYNLYISPILRIYEHERHMIERIGKEWAYISGHIKAKMAHNGCRFCYTDSHDFLDRCMASGIETRILSFGQGEYQYFKINMCNKLRAMNLPIHIVLKSKAAFLEEYFSTLKHGLLVDDKQPQNLPANMTHAWIDRKSDGSGVSQQDNVTRYSNLANIML